VIPFNKLTGNGIVLQGDLEDIALSDAPNTPLGYSVHLTEQYLLNHPATQYHYLSTY